ncbi:hypothetical protein PHLCEN_2v1531 [Hermanssonia centrifuga]|uniref:Uncharacterized protein n=1 Tax=Hermanssonia centrifuga TaxID=98765 RepID=A0A2R6RZR0_9APHY|nr:hypothetical protein PHLCEN_2v1531 [Hermanssonia centrifuga]
MGYAGGGVNGSLRWRDLALDMLLPVDEEKEQAERAAHARKMASGTAGGHVPPQPAQALQDQTLEEEDDDENDENENDEDGDEADPTTDEDQDPDEEDQEDDE